jgi:hypothetical protein
MIDGGSCTSCTPAREHVAAHHPVQIERARQAMIGVRAEGNLHPVAKPPRGMDEADYAAVTAGSTNGSRRRGIVTHERKLET